MFRVIVFASFIICALFWGDLRNWKKYYPTILFAVICNLFYIALYNNNPLWRLEPLPPTDRFLFNDVLISLAMCFTVITSTALIFLSNYPAGKKQYFYIILWILIYAAIEFIMTKNKAITYHNGWSLGWSIFFDVVLFGLIRIHFLYPLTAWGLSALFSIFIWYVFGFPIKKL